MSERSAVLYSHEGAVATVTLNRPAQLNSFNLTMRTELIEALRRAAQDDQVRAVILTGSGKYFSAGADLKAGMPPEGQTVEHQLQDEYRPSLDLIAAMDKPVIAVINGPIAGIALGFAMHCDLAVMADTAFLLSPFSTISLVGDGGVNFQLVRQLGYKRAYEMSIENHRVSAAQALEWGLVNKLTPAEDVLMVATQWAESIAERASLSLAATKRVMRAAMHSSWSDAFDLEVQEQLELLGSKDNIEGVAAFLEKRSPKFTGR